MEIYEKPLQNQCKPNTLSKMRPKIFVTSTKMLVSLRILNHFQQTRMLTPSEIDASSESVEKTGLRARRKPVGLRICDGTPLPPVY